VEIHEPLPQINHEEQKKLIPKVALRKPKGAEGEKTKKHNRVREVVCLVIQH